jgi:hypothetical protein
MQECGLLVKSHSPQTLPETFAKAISQVCDIALEELISWGSKGRESAITAWHEHLTAWEEMLCQLLGN